MRSYRSKVDFIALVLAVLAVFLVDAAALGFSSPAIARTSPLQPFLLLLVASLGPCLVVLVCFPVRYQLGADQLVVRSGVLRWCIPLVDVHRVRPDRSVWPAPALSSERLRVAYQRGDRLRTLCISPAEPHLFLAELVSRDRGLVYEGTGVVRRSGPVILLENVARRVLR